MTNVDTFGLRSIALAGLDCIGKHTREVIELDNQKGYTLSKTDLACEDLPAMSLKETRIIDQCKAKVDALGDWLSFEFGPHEMYERHYDCQTYTKPCENYARKLNYQTSVKSEAVPEPVPLK